MNRKHIAGSLLTLAVAGMLTACSNTESNTKPAANQNAQPATTQPAAKPDTQPATTDKSQPAPATTEAGKDKSSCGGANGCGSKKEEDKKEKDKKEKASCGGANGCGSKK
ncbi:MAG: hypothetical protein K1Y36_11145 [Blastocatellia bacterium]|nr:hypothetical protein [Blastocatellia bacterium]